MTSNQLEKLYIKYHRELYLYAFSLCRNHQQTQNLVSETFFKTLLSIDIYYYCNLSLKEIAKTIGRTEGASIH